MFLINWPVRVRTPALCTCRYSDDAHLLLRTSLRDRSFFVTNHANKRENIYTPFKAFFIDFISISFIWSRLHGIYVAKYFNTPVLIKSTVNHSAIPEPYFTLEKLGEQV